MFNSLTISQEACKGYTAITERFKLPTIRSKHFLGLEYLIFLLDDIAETALMSYFQLQEKILTTIFSYSRLHKDHKFVEAYDRFSPNIFYRMTQWFRFRFTALACIRQTGNAISKLSNFHFYMFYLELLNYSTEDD